jgi:hypothetical protein
LQKVTSLALGWNAQHNAGMVRVRHDSWQAKHELKLSTELVDNSVRIFRNDGKWLLSSICLKSEQFVLILTIYQLKHILI